MIAEAVEKWWAVVAAAVGLAGVFWKYIVSPILKKKAEYAARAQQQTDEILKTVTMLRNDSEAADQEMLDKFNALDREISELTQDVYMLTHDRLQMGHTHFVLELGYCPAGDKENLCRMYDRYISRGQDHLYLTYRDDIEKLPEHPTDAAGMNQWKGDVKWEENRVR